MQLKPLIGLEIHAMLNTRSKLFCSCAGFGPESGNERTCPVCLGYPGSLPAVNGSAVFKAVKIALALNCNISLNSTFERKNYFYPDLPKGYQITQYSDPLAVNGYLRFFHNNMKAKIGISRVHLEEDAGRLKHRTGSDGKLYSKIDLNRCGIPLAEIVTAPDISSPEEAKTVFENIRNILEYLDVCDCRMEEGNLRCDANVSLFDQETGKNYPATEIKNLNSFRYLKKAIESEIERQKELLRSGKTIKKCTLSWEEGRTGIAYMRTKEESDDYRYFPEPDLPVLAVSGNRVNEIKKEIPELPIEKTGRYLRQYRLSGSSAKIIAENRALAQYFETAADYTIHYRELANWISGELLHTVHQRKIPVESFPVKPEDLAGLINRMKEGSITRTAAKTVFQILQEEKRTPYSIIEKRNLTLPVDSKKLESAIKRLFQKHDDAVKKYRAGETKVIGFFIGKVLQELNGNTDPVRIREFVENQLKSYH